LKSVRSLLRLLCTGPGRLASGPNAGIELEFSAITAVIIDVYRNRSSGIGGFLRSFSFRK